MKKLILPLLFTSLPVLAVQEMPSVSDNAIKNKFMTTVKDVEVERLLGASAEFNDCRKLNEFKPKDTEAERNKKLKAATDCFKQKISQKNPEALKKLAEDLKLQNYGLIKSQNVQDITVYLSKKMTKSLTGVDPDDKSFASQKWENRKIVDQKVFIELYTNQLVKSALFEVSRFCFENLRYNAPAGSNPGGASMQAGVPQNFADHWTLQNIQAAQADINANQKQPSAISLVKDDGDPSFFKMDPNADMTKKEDVYADLVKNLGNQVNDKVYSAYFELCQAALPRLCEKFRATAGKTADQTAATDQLNQDSLKQNSKMSVGANACLTIDKLQSIRQAMADTEKVAEEFDKMSDKDSFAIQMLSSPKIYQRGQGADEESLDQLTSVSSIDMLEGQQNDELADLQNKCKQGSSDPECDKFLVKGDELDKAIHNVESEMNLKREIELERVRKFKKPEDLKTYLTDNGYFDLLNKYEADPNNFDVEKELADIYNARKVAEVEALKLKVGKRQVSEDVYNNLSATDKSDIIQKNIQDSKEERARLAQVVLFNNIITSQLSLEDKKTGKTVGRNVNAWDKEYKGLKAAGIDDKLFEGIQEKVVKDGPSNSNHTSVVGGGIIDQILGKKDDQKP